MKRFLECLVFISFCLSLIGAFSGSDPRLNRTRRATSCREGPEYPNGDLCCLSCPAGSFVKSPCSRGGEQGECQKCSHGTFTEHDNGLKQCFTCTKCRPDEEMAQTCSSTRDTQCRCKFGGFCAPDQACEVCRKCSRCREGEMVTRNCTPSSNTECKTLPPNSEQASDTWTTWFVTLGLVILVVTLLTLLICLYRRRRKAPESGSGQLDMKPGYNDTDASNGQTGHCWTLVRPKSVPLDAEEQRQLCEISDSACNSEANLIQPPFCVTVPLTTAPVATYASSPMLQTSCWADEHFNIVPMDGEESLRSCFEFFEVLDFHYHSRFFRHLGLSDNLIKSKDRLDYVDRIHELLNFWLEKHGREASLKDLLKALMDLNQRLTAEIIVKSAVDAGYYAYE